MNLRDAAQRLLQAVDAALPYAPHRSEFDVLADVADDLRAALGEPKGGGNLPPPLSAEPVQLAYKRIGCVGHDCDECQHRALTEPVQEPVAWRWGYRSVTTGDIDWQGYVETPTHPKSPDVMQPLYTAPPQRKPRHVSYVCPQCQWSLDECKPMTEPLSAAIESILHTDDLSEEIHQAQVNSLRAAYDAVKSKRRTR